jgi:hypothetical protein
MDREGNMSTTKQLLGHFRLEAAAFSHEIGRAWKSDPNLFGEVSEYIFTMVQRHLGENYLDISR